MSNKDSNNKSPLFNYIQEAKSSGFGPNVKRRVVLGNFLMSSGAGFKNFNK